MTSATIKRRFHLGTQGNRRGGFRRVVRPGAGPLDTPAPAAAPPMVQVAAPPQIHPLARRMAMAIRCAQLIDSGVVSDQAAVAVVAGMTRAWVTVIMRLNALAPDIQEALLHLAPDAEVDHRAVQRIAIRCDWIWQRERWRQLAKTGTSVSCNSDIHVSCTTASRRRSSQRPRPASASSNTRSRP